jgi:hypothetical protein
MRPSTSCIYYWSLSSLWHQPSTTLRSGGGVGQRSHCGSASDYGGGRGGYTVTVILEGCLLIHQLTELM